MHQKESEARHTVPDVDRYTGWLPLGATHSLRVQNVSLPRATTTHGVRMPLNRPGPLFFTFQLLTRRPRWFGVHLEWRSRQPTPARAPTRRATRRRHNRELELHYQVLGIAGMT